MTVVKVAPGVCQFETRIVSEADDAFNVTLEISSDCANVRRLADQLKQVSALSELRLPMPETAVYQAAAACKLHVACPVPSAILKAIEVATGMALPADVHMTICAE